MVENGKKDEDLDLLLPWYVNGSLSAEETKAVEAYLEGNPHARDEVELLSALRGQVKEEAIENSPGELGLKRLRREISLSEKQDAAPAESGTVVTIASWWRPLAVAACLAVVIQAGFMVDLTRDTGDEVGTAGGEIAYAPPVLQVTFAPTATEQDIREVLQSAGTSIASGPTAIGVYGLRLLGGDTSDAQIDAALTKLQARGDVVTFAERN